MARLIRFFKRSGAERRLVLEAGFWMVAVRLLTLVVPFRYIETYLGASGDAASESLPEALVAEQERQGLLQMRWAVESASRNVPWEATCLPQALVAKALLRRRGIANTLYLGVARDQADERVKAHAWLRSGGLIVVGYQGVEDFKVLTSFADKSREAERSRREGHDG